jgi:HD-GYP domain-containing protein (c-di-GMP phosphodiesterase class II)
MPTNATRRGDLEECLRRLNEIGSALSVEPNLRTLLERILLEARRFTGADAGTLFLAAEDHLTFEITQNDTLGEFTGSREAPKIPPVPLNRESASGYTAVTGKSLNIEDVYDETCAFQFEGPKLYDRMTGYRTNSMLVIPMLDHEDQVIGVLQLLNARDDDGSFVAFSDQDEELIQSLASQAAVAVNNVRLIQDTEQLFESLIQVMATAIDERSPYTGGHIRRVAEMTMELARAVNACDSGPLADTHFDDEQLDEIRIASWMHDIGKVTTPEWVVDKPTKLTTIFDRIELLRTRFDLMAKTVEADMLKRKLDSLERGEPLPTDLEEICTAKLHRLQEDFEFLARANQPGEFMDDDDLERLNQIRTTNYSLDDKVGKSSLTEDEFANLCIRKGSLTDGERQKINDHAAMSIKMLGQIPFTRHLRQVPDIAGAHHEKLDGSGYPLGLKGSDISLQARILALVDIFESLSADDRPYRAKPMPRDLVLRILEEEVDAGHLDRDVFDLFMREQLYVKLDEIKAQMAQKTQAPS